METSHVADSDTAAIEKDEFGRDIRPPSPDTPKSAPTPPDPAVAVPAQPPPPVPSLESGSPVTNNAMSISEKKTSIAAANTPNTIVASNSNSKQLEEVKFDVTTADFSLPSSWEALAKMWEANYGYCPSTEELMAFVMARNMAGAVASQSGGQQMWTNQSWPGSGTSGQSWQAGAGGQGNYSQAGQMGYGYGSQAQWGYTNTAFEPNSDAVVLGGGTGESVDNGEKPASGNSAIDQTAAPQAESKSEGGQSGGGGLPGKMQRVGDKWVFVRDSS